MNMNPRIEMSKAAVSVCCVTEGAMAVRVEGDRVILYGTLGLLTALGHLTARQLAEAIIAALDCYEAEAKCWQHTPEVPA